MPTHAVARAFLESVAKRRILITYQELANALRILPPHSIHRVTEALERLMRARDRKPEICNHKARATGDRTLDKSALAFSQNHRGSAGSARGLDACRSGRAVHPMRKPPEHAGLSAVPGETLPDGDRGGRGKGFCRKHPR